MKPQAAKTRMEALSLTNTLTRRKEAFSSREPGKIAMFTCGPSVYSRAHIGNFRTFLYEDVLQRYLEYLGFRVERMINFTDVEDKAIEEAQAKDLTLKELTAPVEELFYADTRRLGIKLPDYIPRSSTSVDQAVRLIQILLEKGYAYFHRGDVFYDPLKYPGFGRLYGLDMRRWPKQRQRFRRDTYPGMRWNLGDFILWHGGRGDHIYWNTEIGMGRPSWNIQDAAMITKHLGYRIDLSCGGMDNLYRHHDYTLAVVESVSGETFCPFWLHGGHVLSRGQKMSKSKGNVIYLTDLLEQGYSPHAIRLSLIYRHYRKKLNMSPEYLDEISSRLETFTRMVQALAAPGGSSKEGPLQRNGPGLEEIFRERMNDDLDVKGAFDGIFDRISTLTSQSRGVPPDPAWSERLREELTRIDQVLLILDAKTK